jgi:hypothetical protein
MAQIALELHFGSDAAPLRSPAERAVFRRIAEFIGKPTVFMLK